MFDCHLGGLIWLATDLASPSAAFVAASVKGQETSEPTTGTADRVLRRNAAGRRERARRNKSRPPWQLLVIAGGTFCRRPPPGRTFSRTPRGQSPRPGWTYYRLTPSKPSP